MAFVGGLKEGENMANYCTVCYNIEKEVKKIEKGEILDG